MKPSGIPDNYFEVLKKYTSCGFRVLSVCSKKISAK
jgi:magnesium-transporting ATPase (P-type)